MAGGRKREFCKDKALDAAMHVFWKQGYLGASLSDLTDGMGINKPSMYSAFGNKEDLFVEATNHYIETRASKHSAYLFEPGKDLRTRIGNYLKSVISGQCEQGSPKGCYISLCVAEAAGEGIPDEARELIEKTANHTLNSLIEFLQRDDEAIELGLDKVAEEKALFLVSLMHGTASMARAGKSFQELESVADSAIQGLY